GCNPKRIPPRRKPTPSSRDSLHRQHISPWSKQARIHTDTDRLTRHRLEPRKLPDHVPLRVSKLPPILRKLRKPRAIQRKHNPLRGSRQPNLVRRLACTGIPCPEQRENRHTCRLTLERLPSLPLALIALRQNSSSRPGSIQRSLCLKRHPPGSN